MNNRILFGVAGAASLASVGMLAAYFVTGGATASAARAPEAEAPAVQTPAVPAVDTPPVVRVSAPASPELELRFEDRSVERSWADLGVSFADGEVRIDQEAAVSALVGLSPALNRAPADAHLDLEHRRLVAEELGYSVDVYGSVAALRTAAYEGSAQVELPGVPTEADVTAADLNNIDISHVMGKFTTRFAVAEKSRNYNLKLAASKLDGHVLMPGVEFSFNDVVGARTEREGYKIAHVITAGEMVDGLAGGTCQISTTLHGAAFFAGLEILRSIPHSRPSVYVTMGLDATVVYPVTDLRLRNPYDFPVVIRYRVGNGESYVEILGKGRPYDKVAFEREILEELPFDTVTREDEGVPMGSMVIEQEGFPGYRMKRFRKFYQDGKLVKTDTWTLRYAPVTEYARMGTNPDPTLKPPKPKKSHGPRPPKDKTYRLVQ